MFDKDNKFGFINNNDNSNSSDIKKYIDDNTIIHPLPVYKKVESPSMIMYMVNIMDLKEYTAYGAVLDMNTTKYQRCRFIYICDDGKNKVICSTGDNLNDTIFRVSHYDTSSTLEHGNSIYSVDYTKHSTPTDVTVKITLRNYLGIYNSTEYTPTEDYNPATKKYVDDNKTVYTVSSKVLVTVPANNIVINNEITINNASINKNRRYYIEFLGSKKLCSLVISEKTGNSIACSIGNYNIQAFNSSTNIVIYIDKINEDDTTATTFTDLVIYEEEVKYLENKYLETDLVLQNSISLGRVGKIGTGSSAIGMAVEASGASSHAEGSYTQASGGASHAEGSYTQASGDTSHAEGYRTAASGKNSHAEGSYTQASGDTSHAEGTYTIASGDYGSHAEGSNTIASGVASHAEGSSTTASNYYSHAEGDSTTASGENSHSEGKYTTASGESSHAEGDSTTASAYCSHAEGNCTTASGESSHAEGSSTTASSQNQHVQGKYNIEDLNGTYAHIVGNGEDGKNSNAHTLDWQGNAWYSGKLSQEGTPTEGKDLTTKKYVDDNRDYYFKVPTILYDDPNLPKGYVDISTLETGTNYRVNSSIVSGLFKVSLKALNDDGTWFTVDDGSNTIGWSSMLSTSICVELKSDTFIGINMSSINNYCKYLSITKENGKWKLMQTKLNSISPDNMYEYDVVNDYNPATKKYVDDKVTSLPQLSFNEAGELVVTINGVSKTFVPKNV